MWSCDPCTRGTAWTLVQNLVKNTGFKKDIYCHIWVRAYFWTEELSWFCVSCWMIWTHPLCELRVINLIPEDKVIISAILNWLLLYFMHSTHILQSESTEGLSKYIGHTYNTVVYYNKHKSESYNSGFVVFFFFN